MDLLRLLDDQYAVVDKDVLGQFTERIIVDTELPSDLVRDGIPQLLLGLDHAAETHVIAQVASHRSVAGVELLLVPSIGFEPLGRRFHYARRVRRTWNVLSLFLTSYSTESTCRWFDEVGIAGFNVPVVDLLIVEYYRTSTSVSARSDARMRLPKILIVRIDSFGVLLTT